MKTFLNLLSKLKYPALALSTTGIGFGICSLLHVAESEQMQEKNKQIKKWQNDYYFSQKRTKEQREEFIADALKVEDVKQYALATVYAKAKEYANCVKSAFKKNEENNRGAIFIKDYLSPQELNKQCQEPKED